jgi:hypothetical protein
LIHSGCKPNELLLKGSILSQFFVNIYAPFLDLVVCKIRRAIIADFVYVPKPFSEPDQNVLHDFIGQHSFATLVDRPASEQLDPLKSCTWHYKTGAD